MGKNETTARKSLSFDGFGINDRDKYRTRLAVFHGKTAADKFGPLFAAAPELLNALEETAVCLAAWMEISDPEDVRDYDKKALKAARAAIAKAKGL